MFIAINTTIPMAFILYFQNGNIMMKSKAEADSDETVQDQVQNHEEVELKKEETETPQE